MMSSDSIDDGFDSVAFEMSPASQLPEEALDLTYSDPNNVINYSCHNRASQNLAQSPWEGNNIGSDSYSPYPSRDGSRSNSHSRSRSPTPNTHSSPSHTIPLDTQVYAQANSPPLSISSDSPTSPSAPSYESSRRVPPLRLRRLRKPSNNLSRVSDVPLNTNSPPMLPPSSLPIRTESSDYVQPQASLPSERNELEGTLKPCIESGNNPQSSLSQRTEMSNSQNNDSTMHHTRAVTAAADSTQEVVDIEQTESQPCVVDLTAEDDTTEDDDVEIVSTEQSVVFLGTESRRKSRRRRRTAQGSTGPVDPRPSDTIILNDSDQSPTPPNSYISSTAPSRTPELFGDLLVPQPSGSMEESATSVRRCSCVLPIGATARGIEVIKDCPLHRQVPRISERGQNLPGHPNSGPHHSRTIIMDAPIPQDVLADIASIYAEDRYNHFPPSLRSGPLSLLCSRAESSAGLEIGHARNPFLGSFHAVHQEKKSLISSDSEETPEWSCPICFESKKEAKTAGKSFSSTTCGHVFCTPCLEASLKQAKLCPICRRKLSKKQYHTVFI